MDRQQIESIIAAGHRFKIHMADGRIHDVPHPDFISLPPRGMFVVVYDDDGRFFILPFRTMTGIETSEEHASSEGQ